MIIAIDGPAGSGKSTTSKLVAKKLGISFEHAQSEKRLTMPILYPPRDFNYITFDSALQNQSRTGVV